MFFKFEEGKSLAGMVLAASPSLLDPNFHQTLVFLAEHSADGALGMVMNRPLGKKLGDVSADDDLPEPMRNILVFQGGPMKPTGLLLAHFQRGENDEDLRCEVVTDPQEIVEPPKSGWVRAFAGYAGWGDGQLEAELRERAWLICRPHLAMLEDPVPSALWQAFINEDQRWRKLHCLLPKSTSLD